MGTALGGRPLSLTSHHRRLGKRNARTVALAEFQPGTGTKNGHIRIVMIWMAIGSICSRKLAAHLFCCCALASYLPNDSLHCNPALGHYQCEY